MKQDTNSILTRSYDLLKYCLEVVENFPRSQKFLLGSRLQNLCSSLLELFIEAYYLPAGSTKKEKLTTANVQLEKLRFFFRLAYEKGYISSGRYREIAEKIQELGRMTGGWLKKL